MVRRMRSIRAAYGSGYTRCRVNTSTTRGDRDMPDKGPGSKSKGKKEKGGAKAGGKKKK